MPSTDGRTIGQRLRVTREQRGFYTARELAIAANVDPNWLYRIEADKTKSPSSLLIQRVAAALGVTIEYLLTGRDRGRLTTKMA